MTIVTHILNPDTQAILLLYGRFGQGEAKSTKPLTLGEYNALARRLQEHGMRPGNLLDESGVRWIKEHSPKKIDADRIIILLERGGLLGIKVEEWTNRGLWILSRGDRDYPQRLKQKLKQNAPPVLYGAGDRTLLNQGGLAVVGSREIDKDIVDYSRRLGHFCAQQSVQIISGGARGVDKESMIAAISAGGRAIGVLAKDLDKESVSKKYRSALKQNHLVLISPFDPKARFNVGNAMARNEYIYALADHALIVNATHGSGGTWAGATEELKREHPIPVWVNLQGEVSEGNKQLEKLGAKAFPTALWQQSFLDYLTTEHRTQGQSSTVSSESENTIIEQFPEQRNIPDCDREDNSLTQNKCIPASTFEAVLPILKQHLKEPRRQKEVAGLLDVQLGQARAWLNKAIEIGIVKKTSAGYALVIQSTQDRAQQTAQQDQSQTPSYSCEQLSLRASESLKN